MPKYTLTDEQKAVINHPTGYHAKILAVAGSGKTSTLVHRIKYLVVENRTNPASIQVLMFNSLARTQFTERMHEEGIPQDLQPKVDTFHSFSYGFIQDLISRGLLHGNWDSWTEDREEIVRITLHKLVDRLERKEIIPVNSIDIEEANQAIQLWKGSLIPPPRAGYYGNKYMPLIYRYFEEERIRLRGLTYADFVPLVVSFLIQNETLLLQHTHDLKHLIVDEYQDVNYGQQRLVELLGGNSADVMVVGDDDQTIYEWRGARSNYIIREFQSVFNNKPHISYTLSHSFRFGPVISQCAYNSIQFNTNRVDKHLVAHDIKKPSLIFLYEQAPGQPTDTNKELADQVITLVRQKNIPPSRIIVLCRMFAQLDNIQAEFMMRKIPFRVVGQKPFFQRREVSILLNYLQLSVYYHRPVDIITRDLFLNIANTPNRMLPRRDLERLCDTAIIQNLTMSEALETFINSPIIPLNTRQKQKATELIEVFDSTQEWMASDPEPFAHEVLSNLITSLNYLAHFEDYYGKGEHSFERMSSIENFILYAKDINLSTNEFIEHVSKLDTTRGTPPEQQIIMTTVFKTKGLEYDYVFIPDCIEGYMPCLHATGNLVYDTSGHVREPEPSESVENERRLFYVAITRAKEAVYIGTTSNLAGQIGRKPTYPSRFLDEILLMPTNQMMTALQETAVGQRDGRQKILASIENFGGIKKITDILLSKYLIMLGDFNLLASIAKIAASSPDIPFRYRFPYTPASTRTKQSPLEKPALHSAWDDIEE